jgi:hypothetical protein
MEKRMNNGEQVRYIVDKAALPEKYPTHKHESAFWESLGRAVATFGFLEEVLSKAIFSFTATRPYHENEIQQAYAEWLPKLERTLVDPLGNLIDTYGKSVRDNPMATIENLDELLEDLREASKIRNVLCHGSWRLPDSSGASIPFFVNRQKEVFMTAIDCQFLNRVQRHATELACEVISTVTHMGWEFPGSNGPGKAIWDNPKQT